MLQISRRLLRNATMAGKPPVDPLIVIIGATGTGKSQLAVEIAKQFNGEIINADAMQMYKGLPIITNKITEEEKEGIPHHLLGIVGLEEEPWRVGVFKRKAMGVIKEIRSRGRLPIVVGGTHYYTQSLLFQDALVRDADSAEDKEDMSSLETGKRFPVLDSSTEEILEKLREVDPVMADRWHPNDRRKLRRSLEIFLTTGKRASDIYQGQKDRDIFASPDEPNTNGHNQLLPPTLLHMPLIFWIHAESSTLKERLDARVDKMVQTGLIPEVTSLYRTLNQHRTSAPPIDPTRGIWVSIGFKQFLPYLTAAPSPSTSASALATLLSDSIAQTKSATRQYAKSQLRWIRIKLLSALSRTHSLPHLFLLNGTNITPTAWAQHVSSPALTLCATFLAHGVAALPPPQSMFGDDAAAAAAELLVPRKEGDLSDRPDLWTRRECEVCGVVAVTEELWNLHIRGRRHRRMVKRSAWRARDVDDYEGREGGGGGGTGRAMDDEEDQEEGGGKEGKEGEDLGMGESFWERR